MSDSKTSEESKVKGYLKKIDYSYFIAFGIGFIIFIISVIIIALYRGIYKWYEAFFFPLLAYFIFQQVLSGFGFITGYIPTAQNIINWLTKVSKKKEYNEKDLMKLDRKLKEIEKKEKRELKKIDDKKNELAETKKRATKIKHLEKLEVELEKNEKEKVKIESNYSNQKEEIKAKQSEFRGKISEKIITKQEEMDPSRFKLIMLLPIFIIMAYGIVMVILGLVNPIIKWAQEYGSIVLTKPVLDKFDQVNEVYKGIMAVWGILQLYVIPTIKIYKDPSKEYIPKYIERKKIFFFFKRKEKDFRQILNRQFEDLRRHYWNIKQIIRKALLIPIGFSIVIVAPIGGLSIILGTKSAILRKHLEKYELIIQIVIGFVLLVLVGISTFLHFTKFVKNLHPIIPIISNLIYGIFLILSFRVFTRHPIIHQTNNKE